MSLLDDITSASRVSRGPACGASAIVAALSSEDAAGLASAMADPSIYGTTIAKVLRAQGHTITAETINRHRRGACQCRS